LLGLDFRITLCSGVVIVWAPPTDLPDPSTLLKSKVLFTFQINGKLGQGKRKRLFSFIRHPFSEFQFFGWNLVNTQSAEWTLLLVYVVDRSRFSIKNLGYDSENSCFSA